MAQKYSWARALRLLNVSGRGYFLGQERGRSIRETLVCSKGTLGEVPVQSGGAHPSEKP